MCNSNGYDEYDNDDEDDDDGDFNEDGDVEEDLNICDYNLIIAQLAYV